MLAINDTSTELLTDAAATAAASADLFRDARCRDGNGTLTHLFFSEDPFTIARAKVICSRCTVAAACLEAAVERAEPWGVWGGQQFVDGVPVAFKRPRGRPPKQPRPIVAVDEVPVPPRTAPSQVA
jgi:WhiB family redox-sensing transcriptional regulator